MAPSVRSWCRTKAGVSLALVALLGSSCVSDFSNPINVSVCGDGVIEYLEQCDDDNAEAGDGCSSVCEVEPAWVCDGLPSVCVNTCGNGIAEGEESCDGTDLRMAVCAARSGFDSGQLGCEADCLGFDFSGCYSCGDGQLQGPEVCDGSELAGETCATQSDFDSGMLACSAGCLGFDTAGCYTCGDGELRGPELCDGAPPAQASCSDFPGFNSGTLACGADCFSLDTSGCSTSCDGSGDCNQCAECALELFCQAEASACSSNAECVQIIDCVNATCQPYTSACQEGCEQSYPGGIVAFQAYLSCVYCDRCPVDCADSGFCAP